MPHTVYQSVSIMNHPEINQHLKLSIDITLDVMSPVSLLGAALRNWAAQHGHISGSSDVACHIREVARQLDEPLKQVKGYF
jgi:hypothetical protein